MRRKNWKLNLAERVKVARAIKRIKKIKERYEGKMKKKLPCPCGAEVTMRSRHAHFKTKKHANAMAKKIDDTFAAYYDKTKVRGALKVLPKEFPSTEDVISDKWRCFYCGIQFSKANEVLKTHLPFCFAFAAREAERKSRVLCQTNYSRLANLGYVFDEKGRLLSGRQTYFSSVMAFVVAARGRMTACGLTQNQFILIDPSANWNFYEHKYGPWEGTYNLCVLCCEDRDPAQVPDFREGSIVILRRIKWVPAGETDGIYAKFVKGSSWIEVPVADPCGGFADLGLTGTRGDATWTDEDYTKLKDFRKWVSEFICANETRGVPELDVYLRPFTGKKQTEPVFKRPIDLEYLHFSLNDEATQA